jgi:hypothetical protein
MNITYNALMKMMTIFCTVAITPIAQCADAFKNPYFEMLKNEFSVAILKQAPSEELINVLRRFANAKWPKDSILSEEMLRVGKAFRDGYLEDYAQSCTQKYEEATCEEDAKPYLAEVYVVFAAEASFDFLMIDAFYRIVYNEVQARGFTAELGDLPAPELLRQQLIEMILQRDDPYYQWFRDSFGI